MKNRKSFSKSNFIMLILPLFIFILYIYSCNPPFSYTDLFSDTEAVEHVLATIYSDHVESWENDDGFIILDSNGYAVNQKESEYVSDIDLIIGEYWPYRIQSNPSGENDVRWVPYSEATDTFEIVGNFDVFDLNADHDMKDIGLAAYLDPFDINGTGEITLSAVFENSDGVPLPSTTNGAQVYLYIDVNRKLTYEIYFSETNRNITNKFKIETSGFTFGDDFVLEFKIMDKETEIKTSDLFTSIYNLDNFVDFFAIYDDMFLFEANQYIFEGTEDVNGVSQVLIKPWTRFWDNHSVYDAVAYSYGCADSVEDFNADMEDQQETLDATWLYGWDSTLAPSLDWDNYEEGIIDGSGTLPLTLDNTVYLTQVSGYLDEADDHDIWYFDVEADASRMHIVLNCGSADFDLYGRLGSYPIPLFDWSSTTPGGEDYTYNNPGEGRWYITVKRSSGEGTYTLDIDITYDELYYPYRPGYSSKLMEIDSLPYDPKSTVYSAGVDCSGFIQRSMSYDGSPYKFGGSGNDYYKIDHRLLWNISGDYNGPANDYNKMNTVAMYDYYTTYVNDNRVVPGDLLVYPDSYEGHAAIVLDVTFINEKRQIAEGNVRVIEATRGNNNQWKVINIQTWDDLIPTPGDYDPRRLILY